MIGILLFLFYLVVACLFVYSLQQHRSSEWWLEVATESPVCTYYFGPFDSVLEAESSQSDYLRDLSEEGATVVSIKVEQCQPSQLTIFGED